MPAEYELRWITQPTHDKPVTSCDGCLFHLPNKFTYCLNTELVKRHQAKTINEAERSSLVGDELNEFLMKSHKVLEGFGDYHCDTFKDEIIVLAHKISGQPMEPEEVVKYYKDQYDSTL